ncbi:hypothetical protein AZ19_4536, partial [Bordetella bronchiseptica E012]
MSRSRFSRFCAMALVAVAGTAMVGASFDAEARRMGGGSSFGRQSTNITQQRQAVTPPAVLRAIAAGPAKARDAGALGHVFAVVPLVEVFFVRGVDVRPDEQFAHGVAVVPDWC